jgi:predicted phosphodiesterase
LDKLWYAAREREAAVALYGHTHCETVEVVHGIQMINPGAVCERSQRRSAYAELLVEESGSVQARLVKWEA